MFNRGSFNRQKFNLASSTTAIAVRELFKEDVATSTELGEDIFFSADLIEECGAESILNASVSAGMSCDENLSSDANAVCDYFPADDIVSEFGSETSICEDLYVKCVISDIVCAGLSIGEDIHLGAVLSDAFENASVVGANFEAEPLLCFEIVNAIVSSAIYDTIYANIDVTIPPGGKLVIDSNDYVVLLDNENALDKQSGGWVELDRSVCEIVVDTGTTATLTVKMLYTELWL